MSRDRSYGSRKFIVTTTAMALGFVLALLGKLETSFATIATGCVVAYNGANAYVTGRGNGGGDG